MKTIVSEDVARQSLVCNGCGNKKDVGLVVCWKCFKHYDKTNPKFVPLKYYLDTFETWQTETWGRV